MKLIGELKEKVEKAENQEEAKKIIKDAGMELTDEEMNQVAGGTTTILMLSSDNRIQQGKLMRWNHMHEDDLNPFH